MRRGTIHTQTIDKNMGKSTDGFVAVVRSGKTERRVHLDGAADLYAARLAARARDLKPFAIEERISGKVLQRVEHAFVD